MDAVMMQTNIMLGKIVDGFSFGCKQKERKRKRQTQRKKEIEKDGK